MKCAVCGAELHPAQSDLLFKVAEQTHRLQAASDGSARIAAEIAEDRVLRRVDESLALIVRQSLEIIRFAAMVDDRPTRPWSRRGDPRAAQAWRVCGACGHARVSPPSRQT